MLLNGGYLQEDTYISSWPASAFSLILSAISPVRFINRVGNDGKIHPLGHPLRATHAEED